MVKIRKNIDSIVGPILCTFFGWFTRRHSAIALKNKRVLFVKLWGVGESILTLPLLKMIHEKYGCTIDVLTTPRNRPVYEGQPFINNLLDFSLMNVFKYNSYDVAIDGEPYLCNSALQAWWLAKRTIGFSHGSRSKLYHRKVKYNDNQHAVQTYLDLIDEKEQTDALIPLFYPESSLDRMQRFINAHKQKQMKLIGVHCGTAESAKCRMWPLERWTQLVQQSIRDNQSWHFIFTGIPQEKQLIKNIFSHLSDQEKQYVTDASGQFSLRELFCFTQQCDIFVSNDTGPMHIAAAMGTPTLGLFSPNTPVRFGPYGKKNRNIYKTEQDHPCINVHKGEIPHCKHPHMELITVNEVYDVLKEMVQQ